jgi:hypothetical protein
MRWYLPLIFAAATVIGACSPTFVFSPLMGDATDTLWPAEKKNG